MLCLGSGWSEAQTIAFNPGMVTSVAGNGSATYSPASYAGPATAAALNFPRRIVSDANGNLYWMEKGGQIARVLASGTGPIPALPSVTSPAAGNVYTVAGNGGTTACAGATDKFGNGCPATQTILNAPYGIAVDKHGNVYLGDTGNNMIRVVYAGGTIPNLPSSPVVGNVYAFAGTGKAGDAGDSGPALIAKISTSHGLAVDGQGNVYFADSGNQSVRAVFAGGTLPGIANPVIGNLYTLAGGASVPVCAKPTSTCGDGGPAIAAQMNGPDSVTVDGTGNIYFGDTGDLRVRAIFVGGALPGITNPVAGNVYTVAGNGVSGSGPDGVQATASSLTSGMGQPFIDVAGNLYIPDGSSNTVRKIDPQGVITTILGGASTVCDASTNAVGDGCAANAATLNGVSGMTMDAMGNAYFADYKNNLIRELNVGASTLNFSGMVGASLPPQTVTISNGGTQALKLTGITMSGPFAQSTSGGTDCSAGMTLDPGGSCNLAVVSTAAQAGTATGTVSAESNALNASSGQNTIQLASVLTLGTTTTSLTISPALVSAGQPVTFTASVAGPVGATLKPGGTVTFLNGGVTLGSATLADGVASFTSSTLALGNYSVTASYGGDASFAGSVSGASSLVVTASPVPVVSLSASATAVAVGQGLTLTATVSQPSGSLVPTGTVVFNDGTTMLGQAALNGSGVAVLQMSTLAIGKHSLSANYGGDGTFVASTSPAVTVTVAAGGQLSLFPGEIVTTAGSHTAGAGFSGDGQAASAAQLKTPLGLSQDSAGNLYIADSANNRIRRVDGKTGVISTVAGAGTACATATLPCGDGGPATAAQLNGPQAVRVDAAGNLYILDKGDHAVRKVTASTGVISTVAGVLGSAGYSGDKAVATAAKLNGPRGLYVDNSNDLYISDSGNAVVRRVDGNTGVITTIAGTGSALGDGGPATAAQLMNPRGVTLDPNGNLYIADIGSYRVRRVDALTGVITTVAGTGTACSAAPCGDGGMATAAQLSGPQDVVVSSAGDLFLSEPNLNSVRRVSPAGMISTIAGQETATAGYGDDGGAATGILLSYPNSLLLDSQGNLYISEANNSLVREVLADATALSFGTVNFGETANQTVTIANTGGSPITISAISVMGGFSQQPSGSADCAAQMTLNAGVSCAVEVQFAPALSGAITGAVNIASNATNTNSGQSTIALNGSGVVPFGSVPDFALSSNLSSLTLAPGATGHLTLTLTPVKNYQGTVTLSCGSLPPDISCVFSPASVTADGTNSPVTAALDIVTTNTTAHLEQRRGGASTAGIFWIPGALMGLVLLRYRNRLGRAYGLAAVLCLMLGLGGTIGCGSAKPYVAPVATTVTVTAVSGSVTHTLSLNVSVVSL
ncbi:MAG: Ig-like domain repeat protein [Edaphobacter sp.]